MKRVLVTGATGFIGRHAIGPLLHRGYEVHAITSGAAPPPSAPGLHWHKANLLDSDAVRAVIAAAVPTCLLHFAWCVEAGQYWLSPENFRWAEASLAMLRAFHDCGGRRALMAGTCAEYDWESGYLSEERTPRLPAHPYGVCKNALHDLAKSFCARSGIDFAWGRIFFVYGPGEPSSKLVSSVAAAILRGETVCCSQPQLIRDYLYVEDVAEAFVAMLDSEVQGAVNIASGQPRTLRDIAGTVASMLSAENMLTFGDASIVDPLLVLGDNRRLRQEVGWQPAYALEAGVLRTIDSLRGWLDASVGVLGRRG
jgi:nucleoside-diphosphate-sugar epimerase